MSRAPRSDTAASPPVPPGGGARKGRKAYSPPGLERLGRLVDVTLAGASPGMGDSMFPNTRP